MGLWSFSQYFSDYTKWGRFFQWNWILNILYDRFFLYQFFFCRVALYDVKLLSIFASLSSRNPWLTLHLDELVGFVISWFVMRWIPTEFFGPIIIRFRRTCRLPDATYRFRAFLVHTFRYHLSVINCRLYFLKFNRLVAYRIYRRFLEIAEL